MCNPKPGTRCFTDARKPVLGRVSKLNEAAEALAKAKADDVAHPEKEVDVTFYEEMVQEAADEHDAAKVMMYSTRYAETNKESVLLEGKTYTKELSYEANMAARSDYELYQAGRFASLYQKAADKDRKAEGGTQVANARHMLNRTFPEIHRQILKKLEKDRDAKLGVAFAASTQYTPETEEIERQYKRNVNAAELAYRVSSHDAAGVVGKDIDKNSVRKRFPTDEREVRFSKTKTGDFHISTSFKVKAANQEEAEALVDQSFSLENVDIQSIQPTGNGDYAVSAKYIYRGGETLAAAEEFHSKAWLGSPSFRATLDQMKYVSENPIDYRELSK